MKSENKIKVNLYAHNWGLLIPQESGVIWEQQTEGVCCNHAEIEGIFIPLDEPFEIKFNKKKVCKRIDLLDELVKLNYHSKPTEKIWKRIKKAMKLDFEIVDAPEGMPPNQEGFYWIKIKKFEYFPFPSIYNIKPILNKKIVLIFPNCD